MQQLLRSWASDLTRHCLLCWNICRILPQHGDGLNKRKTPFNGSAWPTIEFALGLLLLWWTGMAWAQGRPASVLAQRDQAAAASDVSQRRVAVVIGNGAYKDAPLNNPPNDAQDMTTALKGLGFSVATRVNVDQKDMKRSIRDFGAALRSGGVGLFYFAGHGVQSKGRNFLIPVGTTIQSEAELEDEAVDLAFVLNFMEEAQNGVNIVILDACRNNPFARSFRSGARGLAQVGAAKGILIAFATAPGPVAMDGVGGRNGVYTKHLLASLHQQNADIERVFKSVRKAVYQETSGQQIPWEASSLIGEFVFRGIASPSGVSAVPPAIDPVAFDLALWNEIKDRNNPDELRAYLAQYPNGRFAPLARARLSAAASAAAAPMAEEAARRLLGMWNGFYGYNEMRVRNVPFKLTITSVDGSGFTGMISEPATFGDGSSRFLFARVRGSVRGNRVEFVKTYDGTGGQTHSVRYEGVLEVGAVRLKGGWVIDQGNRVTATGFFSASQD